MNLGYIGWLNLVMVAIFLYFCIDGLTQKHYKMFYISLVAVIANLTAVIKFIYHIGG